MTEWFEQSYMPRAEHAEVVAYYRKLVAHLHRQLRELRMQRDAEALEAVVDHSRKLAQRELRRANGGNIIAVDFRRRSVVSGRNQ